MQNEEAGREAIDVYEEEERLRKRAILTEFHKKLEDINKFDPRVMDAVDEHFWELI